MKKYIFTRSLGFKFLAKVALSFFLAIVVAETYARLFSNPYIEYNRANMSLTIFNILVFGLFIVTCSTFVLVFLVLINKEIKYIKYIAKQVKFIANQSLGLTLEVRGNDELSELCANINSMSKELKDKFERERELEKTKNELITNVSHDLRTPLTSIIGYLDFLKNGTFKSEEEQKEYLNSAYNLSTKLKGLIDELFEYTKLSSNEVQLEFVSVNICAILNQLLGEYGPILEKKELRIINNIPDNNLNVKVDIEKIVRVFENILSNAEKYSYKPSDIVINMEKKEEYIVISFSNKGEHISKEKIDKMFERFYRIDPSRSNNVPGSGLGLAISKKIVELHSGQIWAESNGDIITLKVKLELNK